MGKRTGREHNTLNGFPNSSCNINNNNNIWGSNESMISDSKIENTRWSTQPTPILSSATAVERSRLVVGACKLTVPVPASP